MKGNWCKKKIVTSVVRGKQSVTCSGKMKNEVTSESYVAGTFLTVLFEFS